MHIAMLNSRHFAPWLVFLSLVGAWAFASFWNLIDPIILPPPWEVVRAMPRLFVDEGMFNDLSFTLLRLAAALLLALSIGVPTGLILGYYSSVYRSIEGILHALRSVPATALFPLLLLITGVGNWSIIVLASYPSLLIIIVSTVAGIQVANSSRIYRASLFGSNPFVLARDVLIYEAMPAILTGVRTALSYSLALVVAIEMFLGIQNLGLGRRIYDLQSVYKIPETYAAIIIAGTVGIILNLILNRLERYLLRWIPESAT